VLSIIEDSSVRLLKENEPDSMGGALKSFILCEMNKKPRKKSPSVNELAKFYHKSATLAVETAEKDPHSFIFRN
jgi:hypothetical protein